MGREASSSWLLSHWRIREFHCGPKLEKRTPFTCSSPFTPNWRKPRCMPRHKDIRRPHAVLGSGLHFGAVGRPWPSRLSDRDSDRCEYQSANAGVGTHARVIVDISSELGCLLLRFCHARSISESVRPRRVVRIASSSPNPVGVGGLTPEWGLPSVV